MTTLTWLHLSDWHQTGKEFKRVKLRDALIKDIEARTKISPDLATIDLVVFSGDVAFFGKQEEYQAARSEFFGPVLKAAGVPQKRLFIVPGNHDFNREHLEYLGPELQKPLVTSALVEKWLEDTRRKVNTLLPFKEYHDFVAGYTAQDSPDYASVSQFTIGGKQVALLGLNSAWMCARHKEKKGRGKKEVDDYGYLIVGDPQLYCALEKAKDAQILIVVLHHPFDWLITNNVLAEKSQIKEQLSKTCHFILHGHEHESNVTIPRGTIGDCAILSAGSSYDRTDPATSRYAHGYNFVHLDFSTGKGTVYLRRYDERQGWIRDTGTTGDDMPGYSEFTLPKDLGKFAPDTPLLLSTTPNDRRLVQVEEKYRRLLLETCDIISLVGLPEQDRYVAERQLALRQLYIPLHAWVEVPIREVSTGEEPDAPEMEAVRWDALEKRRAATRRGLGDENQDAPEREHVPVGERLTQARRLVILGDPGAGKTTLTRWIATAYLLRLKADLEWRDLPAIQTLPDADYFPIIIRCRELDATCINGALEDILRHTLRKAELSTAEADDLVRLLRARLEAGTALLMLDGLDEIIDPQVRACFCEQVERMAVAYQAPIVITSRIVGYREMGRRLGRDFEHLTLADLTSEEKDDFARHWCELTELPERREAATEELIHDIHSAERIERLTGNPMLLTTMALVKRSVGKLPNRRAALYREAVQVLLKWRREVDKPLDWGEAIPQLEYLAYAMCNRGVQQLQQDEVLKLLWQMRKEYPNIHAVFDRSPEAFLQHLEARTGILIEAGRVRHLGMEIPVYEFRHLTFQEYLAARALVDGRFPDREVRKSLAEHIAPLAGRTAEVQLTEYGLQEISVVEAWREALRLCISMCNDDDVDPALRAILTPLSGEPSATARARAIQAILCLADEPNVSAQTAEEILQAFAAQVREDDGLEQQVRTGVNQAAIELATTRWAGRLRTVLLDEFCRCSGSQRESPGRVVSLLAHVTAPREGTEFTAWLRTQINDWYTGSEPKALAAALSIAGGDWEWRFRLVSGAK